MTGQQCSGGHDQGRRSIRLPDYDYKQEGAYFVTICTKDRKCIFGEIIEGRMRLNEWGQIADACWGKIPVHFPNAILDEYVVMPNHIHGIIIIIEKPDVGTRNIVGTRHAMSLQGNVRTMFGKPTAGSLSTMIGSYNSAVSKQINVLRGKNKPSIWQGRFYEHIIRNRTAYDRIRQYIHENPRHWPQDEENV